MLQLNNLEAITSCSDRFSEEAFFKLEIQAINCPHLLNHPYVGGCSFFLRRMEPDDP